MIKYPFKMYPGVLGGSAFISIDVYKYNKLQNTKLVYYDICNQLSLYINDYVNKNKIQSIELLIGRNNIYADRAI